MSLRGSFASMPEPRSGFRRVQLVLAAGLALGALGCASATVGDYGSHADAASTGGGSGGGTGGSGGKGGSGGAGGAGGGGGTSFGSCDPLTNSGCGSGQKCTALQSNGQLALGCDAVGSKKEGDTCSQTTDNGVQTGDDCASGLACFATQAGSATCHRMCTPTGTGNVCPSTEICSLAAPGLDTIEFCRATTTCAPLTQTGCTSTQACYFSSTGAICAQEGSGKPGDACANANDCAKGSTCIVGASAICSSFCSVSGSGGTTCTGTETGGSTCTSLGNAAAGLDVGYCK
jgi:hypothetical protein